MNSQRQHREKMKLKRAAKRDAKRARQAPVATPPVRVNVSLLAPNNSYGEPEFVRSGYYVEAPPRARCTWPAGVHQSHSQI